MKTVVIAGAGLAGLISAIELSKKGVPCTVYERKKFPFHRVCGEYISNEALPYLESNDLYPRHAGVKKVDLFLLSTVRGQTATMPLDLGGFAVSRFRLDSFLAERAKDHGAILKEGCELTDVRFEGNKFVVTSPGGEQEADVVIGAFGKRSRLDARLNRGFMKKRSPYVAVKYHARTDAHPDGVVALHNFNGGYCGVVNVENNLTNICYLVHRSLLQRYKAISTLEQSSIFSNPHLRQLFATLKEVSDPIVINEVSFARKEAVADHVIMAGDAAGMIAPLCGNGMAIAIHTGKIAASVAERFCSGGISREQMEQEYTSQWRANFEKRLALGRSVQHLFGGSASALAWMCMTYLKPLGRVIMRHTHGAPFS